MAAKKRGLGERGLGALLAGSKVNLDQELKDHDGELREVPIDLIQRGRYQPRRDMDPAALQELADSIRQQGVMQPVVVRPIAEGRYELIAGERRWRATQMAELDSIPAIIRDVPDEAAIAMALMSKPALLILDEPTTALDVTVEAAVVELVKDLGKKYGTSMLFISHNLGLVLETCDRLCVMYSGEAVERGSIEDVFDEMQHPYTQALMKAVPIADPNQRKSERELNFKPIPSPIHPVGYEPGPSEYKEVSPGHFVLTSESGY